MDKFTDLLSNLAAMVGVQVERLWPQVVYVYWLRNLIELTTVPCLILVLYLGTRALVRAAHAAGDSRSDDAEFFVGAAAIVCGLAALAVAVVYIIHLPSFVSALMAPEAAFVLDRLPK